MDMGLSRERFARAEESAEALRSALAWLGFPERVWGSVRPIVTASGGAYVDLGVFRPDVADRIAAALTSGPEGRPPH